MNQLIIKSLIRFALLAAFQVFILNNINIGGFINPNVYILYILVFPVLAPRWFLIITSFLLGLTIDLFTHTPGLHAAASTFAAFVRPGILKLMTRNKEVEAGTEPVIREFGFSWFLAYASAITFLHHLALYYLETFRFSEFFTTLYRATLSSVATIVLVIVVLYLTQRKK